MIEGHDNLIDLEIFHPWFEKSGFPSSGMGEAGFDLTLKNLGELVSKKQGISLTSLEMARESQELKMLEPSPHWTLEPHVVYLGASQQKIKMPKTHMGLCFSKSTLARVGLQALCTPIEPGWEGFLTVELINHGNQPIHLPKYAGVTQVVVLRVEGATSYSGSYQNQRQVPVMAGAGNNE